MLHRISLIFTLLLFVGYSIQAQEDGWSKPSITDRNMTISPDQNKKWKMGEYGYSAKPNSALEVGLHAGFFSNKW